MQRVSPTDFLNRMLEAERAGAKALVVFMEDFPRGSAERKILRRIHDDEAHNCALIGEQLKRLGAEYSHATGEFYDKAIAVQGGRERVAFLVKGLKWAVRQFDRASLKDPGLKKLFVEMRERHLRSIAACEAVARKG